MPSNSSENTRCAAPPPLRQFLLLTLVSLIAFLWFAPLALQRLIARDEGYYLYAAKLVTQGRLPYADFFYPQMPLLPYVYGAWMWFAGFSWTSGRLFAAVVSSVLTVLVFAFCSKRWGGVQGIAAAVFFAGSTLVFSWYATVQTYSLTALFVFSSYCLIYLGHSRFTAGILFGLACLTRLPIAPAGLVLLWQLWRTGARAWRSECCWFLAGASLALSPAVLFLAAFPEQFIFNNLGYHLIRTGLEPEEIADKRLVIFEVFAGLSSTEKTSTAQFEFLFYLQIVYLAACAFLKKVPGAAALMVLVLFGVSFVPSPPYVQYAALWMPFAVLVAFEFNEMFSAPVRGRLTIRLRRLLIPALALLYFWGVPADLKNYSLTGRGVIGIGANAESWNLHAIEGVSRQIDDLVGPDEVVLSMWPGYLVASHAQSVPGAENHFAFNVARKGSLSARELKQFNILSLPALKKIVSERAVALIVAVPARRKKNFISILAGRSGYAALPSAGNVVIYARPSGAK